MKLLVCESRFCSVSKPNSELYALSDCRFFGATRGGFHPWHFSEVRAELERTNGSSEAGIAVRSAYHVFPSPLHYCKQFLSDQLPSPKQVPAGFSM